MECLFMHCKYSGNLLVYSYSNKNGETALFFLLLLLSSPSYCCENLSTILVSIRAFEVPMECCRYHTQRQEQQNKGKKMKKKPKQFLHTFKMSRTPMRRLNIILMSKYLNVSHFGGNDFLMILNLFPTVRM